MKLIKNKSDFDELMNDLNLNNETFKIHYSSSKLVIVLDQLEFVFYPNKMGSKKNLHFVKKVKEYIEHNNIVHYEDHKIFYNSQNIKIKPSRNYKKDIYEIDLKAAYWYLAFKNGFISQEIFKEGLRIDKKIRLIALGSLAKNLTIFEYKDGGLINYRTERNLHTEGIFFKLAYEVDFIMRDLRRSLNRNSDFLFYWVDAIFFKGKGNIKLVTKKIYGYKLDFKTVAIKRLIWRKNANLIEVEDFNFKVRKFNFKKRASLEVI